MTWTCGKCGLRFARQCTHNCIDDRQKMPAVRVQVWGVLESIAAFVASPGFVTKSDYRARLEICDGCDKRRNRRCSECGCGIDRKALAKAWDCPLGKWPSAAAER